MSVECAQNGRFLTGIIEGFYGRMWPHAVRLAYAGYLAEAGFNASIYAPKGDVVLRRQWRELWPERERDQLVEVAEANKSRGLAFGVGLSPMELYRSYGQAEREQLRRKVTYLEDLGIGLLAILFDDMPGDIADLAARQAEIIADVVAWAPRLRILMCPTYYSHDPVLQRYFGNMPDNYWADLGSALPSGVDIFWTGNEVCSQAITAADIEGINRAFGRPVCLWDNYPVNDGPKRSNSLYLAPLAEREPALRQLLSGHLCNPMNQALLSLPALAGLARLYCLEPGLGDGALGAILGSETQVLLQEHATEFRSQGLSGMGEQRCAELAARYRSHRGAAAQEVVEWLEGKYAFDPACLTD